MEINSSKKTGRPRLRRGGDVREDVINKKIQTGIKIVADRDAWKRIVEQVKTHKELYCQRKKVHLQ
jgi:hypothetical protein